MRQSLYCAVLIIGFCVSIASGQQNVAGILQDDSSIDPLTGQIAGNLQADVTMRMTNLANSNRNKTSVQFVRFDKVDDQKKKTIREDATILNHMITKQLTLKSSQSALGVSYQQSFGKNGITYDDHGLRFVYHIPVQLIPDKDSKPETKEDQPKSAWDKAKAEINQDVLVNISASRRLVGLAPGAGSGFNKSHADHLNKTVRMALSNANNVRDLNENDMITVIVYGTAKAASMRSVKAWRVKWNDLKSGKSESAIQQTSYFEKSTTSRSRNSQLGGVGAR